MKKLDTQTKELSENLNFSSLQLSLGRDKTPLLRRAYRYFWQCCLYRKHSEM